jgi:hypothetical protein
MTGWKTCCDEDAEAPVGDDLARVAPGKRLLMSK